MCALKPKHPLVETYEEATFPDEYNPAPAVKPDPALPGKAYFKATELIKPVHVVPASFVQQLADEVHIVSMYCCSLWNTCVGNNKGVYQYMQELLL